MAYTLYKYQMTMSGPNGAAVTDKGKDMSLWIKQSDGTWKMVADTFNSDMPFPPGTTHGESRDSPGANPGECKPNGSMSVRGFIVN
jgi:hypothetical protein